MLFNATQAEELRVAIVDGRNLCDFLLEYPGKEQKKANIYKGRVTRIEPSLEAAFIDYGQERHGFLPIKEVAYSLAESQDQMEARPHIRDLLKEGQEILVQVDKEERGNKGAALSTFISLAGSYLVLMPNNPKAGGVSRRIEGDDRQDMKEALSNLTIPEGMGVIIRTAGVGRSKEELQWDLDYLVKLWASIKTATETVESKTPFLVYQESDVILRALRDHMRPDIDEIIIDNEAVYQKIKRHIAMFRPAFAERVRLYNDVTPLFTRYQIESQIETVYQRNIRLPSGGSIVIDRTEALVAIDINSAQSTKGGDIEETAFHTNLEAADEIARQLRLRDLGGLIVVDFIDMVSTKHQRDVEERLTQAITHDRARIQLGRISRFGLLEMSRQRLRAAVGESTQELCPRCHGRGSIRSVESLAISALRLIEENAVKEGTGQVHAQVPVEVATYLLNEKRREITEIENKHKVLVFIIANPHMHTPDFEVIRFRQNQANAHMASYKMVDENKKVDVTPTMRTQQEEKDIPVVKDVLPEQPAPVSQQAPRKAKPNLIARIMQYFVGTEADKKQKSGKSHYTDRRTSGHNQRSSQQRYGHNKHRSKQQQQQRSHNSGKPNNRRYPARPANNNNANDHRTNQTSKPESSTQHGHYAKPRHEAPRYERPKDVKAEAPIIITPMEAKPAVAEARPVPAKPEAAPVKQQVASAPVVKHEAPVKPAPAAKPAEANPFVQVETQASAATPVTYSEPKRVRPQRAPRKTEVPADFVMIETQQKETSNQ